MSSTNGHVPYRDSKLTRLLQPALSGSAAISVICTMSPLPECFNESMSTLIFAARLKKFNTNPQVNIKRTSSTQLYQTEIRELKTRLSEMELKMKEEFVLVKDLELERDMWEEEFRDSLRVRSIITLP